MKFLLYASSIVLAALSCTNATPTPVKDTRKATSCTVTAYASVSAAVASCTAITLDGITVPGGSTLDLTKLQAGSKVTFSGTTTFEYAAVDVDLIEITGSGVEITGDSGHVIDGNGPAWWDGKGSNSGGSVKPDHFIVLSNLVSNSRVYGLNIKNWPTHCFEITGAEDLIIENLTLDNSAGDAPNSKSGGLAAAHNTDGFDIDSSMGVILRNTVVMNQDDCVAVTSGTNITVSGMTCSGGHGLSIGSVGGKSDNTVSGVTFSDSTISNSQNGARIKSNSGTTGSIENIVYQNIKLSEISDYGIDIQQDYLNGGPTGNPTNGVTIKGVTMTNVTGTATSDAKNYYILCGKGSCSDFIFNDISITGGSGDSCNYTPSGDFKCN